MSFLSRSKMVLNKKIWKALEINEKIKESTGYEFLGKAKSAILIYLNQLVPSFRVKDISGMEKVVHKPPRQQYYIAPTFQPCIYSKIREYSR